MRFQQKLWMVGSLLITILLSAALPSCFPRNPPNQPPVPVAPSAPR